ncbi:uncharacterized protein LOC123560456 [Mercenaria mercenaria]|uniref:uncharacterized protein LOC123560456 n=1 Tax=Mercenaria mercenaria TaxID=6596 RepID=UPI001E1DF9E7|nr:uncharacterized protein LOC123560456 [Mercenaria mercenaria]
MSETSEGNREGIPFNEADIKAVPDTPPVIRLPCCPIPYTSIELKTLSPDAVEVISEVERCKQVVARLQREKVVAMAAEGINIGREGPLTLIQIGTCSGLVFIFDILMNRDLIGRGRLQFLLEDEHVVKVLHDCSNVSAALTFQFATTLRNVFDTQVAHFVIEEHKGRRLPAGLKVSDICLQYSDNAEKFYTYDWRTNSKLIWMATMGNFWANRPLTPDMIEFAAGDVIVLIPDVYRHQSGYIEENGLRGKFEYRVDEWLQIGIDDVVKEKHGKRVAQTVQEILQEMDSKYDDRVTLFNILNSDEENALSISTYEDAERISERVRKLKSEQILSDINGIELKMRSDAESWEGRSNILDYLRFYMQIPDSEVREKATNVSRDMLRAVLEHIEEKYKVDTTTNMLSTTEREALLTISYLDIAQKKWGSVLTALYWRFMQEEVHGMINFLRFYPSQFSLTEAEYSKVGYFARNKDLVPEEVCSLSDGLLHAIRAYNAANGGYVIDVRRRSGAF